MRVFVAGSGGYLGIPLCHQLAKEGHDVIAFDRYFFGKRPSGDRITVVVGDTRNIGADDLRGVDAVFDLAGLSNDASCDIDPSYTSRINVGGAIKLIEAALGAKVRRYIYSSSASVYGHGETTNLTETSPVHPLTEYAKSKLEVERYMRNNCRAGAVILRNATVFGLAPRMRFDLAVNVMTARAMLEGVVYVMGGGNQWRPLIHVGDVVSALMWAMYNAHDGNVSGETFNVGCQANQMTVRTLAGRVANTFPNVRIHNIPDDADARSYHLSFEKLKKVRPRAQYLTIESGVWEVRNALTRGETFTDPTTNTLSWYKQIIDWNQRLEEFKRSGPVL